MHNFITRGTGTVALAAGLVLVAGGSAAAHVTVDAPGAAKGGYTVATFKVPTESDTAATTALRVAMPNLKSVRTEPLPGWTSTVERNDKGETIAVAWTADPGNPGVGPGQFQRFVLSLGPLPDQDTVIFPAEQTYSDGKVVAWDQPSTDGAEPERPAPNVILTANSGGHGGDHQVASGETSESGHDTVARWLGGLGLALGLFGAALGLGLVFRSRQAS
ncbi:YcnI family copper-binding membrane protein [Nocardia mangyaensis]|uniref:YcnI family copper-binding membrane protein n=1 Tax=Nocardia mangyaensis TaxID=2213200 RepID=UPI0026757AB3|nr:YcnI family protein [Nocardia mangyaensis]MDO3647518.1 YcnI family protein [Nocardia mangyaensis]